MVKMSCNMRFLKHQQKSVNPLEEKLLYASAGYALSKRVPLNLLLERRHHLEGLTSQASLPKIFWAVVALYMRALMLRMMSKLLKIYSDKLIINRLCKLCKMLRFQELFRIATKTNFLQLQGLMEEIGHIQAKVGFWCLLSPSKPKIRRTRSFSSPK